MRRDDAPNLFATGVAFVDVSALPGLAEITAALAATGGITQDRKDAAATAFSGARLGLGDGRGELLVLHVANTAGLTLRFVGPGGEGQFDESLTGEGVGPFFPIAHSDQNIHGEPIRSVMGGLAPLLFHPSSPIQLLNVWLPAQR